ncbi:MAG: hypothetical protein AB1405_17180, partial [Bdellovibrionota bacterium]
EALALLRSAEFVQKICGEVEEGATPHVTAFAEGLSLQDFWLVWGLGLEAQKKKDKGEQEKLLSDFVLQVQRALARARVEAEKRVHKKSPHVYLGSSPACTGGYNWKPKRKEPLTDQQRFQRSGYNYLCYSDSCTTGLYCLDPTPPGPPEPEAPCPECEEAARQKRVEFVNEILRQFRAEKAKEEADEIAPPPLGEGAPKEQERAGHTDAALSRPAATLSQGERGTDEAHLKGPGP